MIPFPGNYTDADLIMLKTKEVLSETSAKSKNSNQIWPLLVQQKTDSPIERLRLNERNRPNPPRTRGILRSDQTNERSNATKTNISESFHNAISPTIGLAQFFGLFPLSGVRSSTPLKLRFTKYSFISIYAFTVTTMICLMTIFSVIHMIRTLNSETFEVKGGIAAATAGAVFYGNSLLGTVLFFWISPRWVYLQRDWRAMEQFIDSNNSDSPRLRWKFTLISVIVLLLSLTEHTLSIFNATEDYVFGGAENTSFLGFLELYCERSHAFVLETVQYNLALGIYIFTVSKLATFTWNFTDLFIILVSTGLAERYKSLNKKVMISVTKQRSSIDWSELREDYASLSCLVKKVDSQISPLILLSFANNLYFICLQLLNGLSRPSDSTLLSAVYFFGSFAFLIGRTVAVTLFTARINDQSRLALPYIYTCSAATYNIETQRLQYQLTTDDIALTGLRFFSITRNFMLAVGGAVVTYEVVLLQFNVAMNT